MLWVSGVPKDLRQFVVRCSFRCLGFLEHLLCLLPLAELSQCDRVERDVSRLSRLGPGQRNNPAVEGHISPLQLELFARPHPGVDRDEERGDVLGPVFADRRQQPRFFRFAQKTRSFVVFCFRFDQAGRVHGEHMIFDCLTKDE